MTTFLDLQNRVYTHLRDSDHDFYDTDIVKGWLNDGYIELVVRLRLFRRREDAVVVTSGVATVPADLFKIEWVRNGAETLEGVSDDVFYSWQDSGLTPSTSLYRRSIDGLVTNALEIYPVPDDGTLDIAYLGYPGLMNSDDDAPEIPQEWHPRITYYALAQAYMQKDDPTSSDRWLARFEAGLPPMRGDMPEPFTMTIDPGPFDRPASYVDADDPSHI